MNIYDNHPLFLPFLKNEVATLQYIHTRHLVEKTFPDLAQKIQLTYYDYKDKSDATLRSLGFKFRADFDMTIEGSSHKVFVGAQVIRDHEMTTYFLAICGKNNSTDLVRKFHFDFANPKVNTEQRVPVFHLQYGGSIDQEMEKLGISDKKIEVGLSVPRLFYPPINLALLLDLIFCEFESDLTKKIIENPDWRTLVLKNEEQVLQNYYKNISNHANSQKYNRDNLIRDFCYTTNS